MSADALRRLRDLADALEAVAAAVASADAAHLDACERPLEQSLAQIPAASQISATDAPDVRRLLLHVERTLARCRAIGTATTELVVTSLAAQGVAHGYKPAGAGAPVQRMGRMGVRV